MQNIIDYLSTAPSKTINVLAIIVCAIIVQSLLKIVLQRSTVFLTKKELFRNTVERQKRIKTINSVIGAVAALVVWGFTALLVLGVLGIPIGPIIASAGIIGAIIAFGTQSLIRDFVSGLFIIAENQYHIDDIVNIGPPTAGIYGKVEAVSVRITTVRGEDGSLYYIPNGTITIASNKSVGPIKETIAVELNAKTNLTDFAKELSIIAKDIQNDPGNSNLILEGPTISGVVAVTDASIKLNLEFKTTAPKRDKATSAVWRALATASKEKKIKLV